MTTAALPHRPFFETSGVRFRLWPIVLAALATEPLLRLGREPARALFKAIDGSPQHVWLFLLLANIAQGIVGVAAILVMRRVLPVAQDNLRWPPGKSYAGLGVAIGIGMALLMFVVDYGPELLRNAPPQDYPTDPGNALDWIVGMLAAPLGEETIFRGLFVGALAVLVPGRVRIGRIDLPLAAYIVALLFAGAHWQSFFGAKSLHEAIGQQLYAALFGLTYVWLMERSKSLLAPAIAHGLSDALEVAMVIVWRLIAGV